MKELAAGPALLLVLGLAVQMQSATMKLGERLVLEVVESPSAPRAGGYLLQADRGSRKGQYLFASSGPGASTRSVEYRLLGPGQLDPLPEVDVLGIHYIKVRPERREAFEQYVAGTLHPIVGNLRPDLRLLYYKAVDGPDAGSYITVFALTRESRDKYWPGGSDSDELKAAFTTDVKQLAGELRTYLVEGSYAADDKLAAAVFESREWTDFVIVPARR